VTKRLGKRGRSSRILVASLVALFACGVLGQQVLAAPPDPGKRSVLPGSTRKPGNPFSRRGVEIWAEFPRATAPLGAGYEDDYDISPGWGFGVGIGLGFFDYLVLEGRASMTGHVSSSSEDWDLDYGTLGVKYVFLSDRRAQPFVGLGVSRATLEIHRGELWSGQFRRVTGSGWSVCAGMDYFITAQWMLSVRSDYAVVSFSDVTDGAGAALDDSLDGNSLSMSASIGWRLPVW
jgi:opacity protein-like surface antigen